MRVFNYNDKIINCSDNDPQIDRLLKDNAEELPIEIFGDYPHYANNDNTKMIDGEWVFDTEKVVAKITKVKMIHERQWRDNELKNIVDTKQLPLVWADLSEVEQQLLRDYRRALLDYPNQPDYPNGQRPTYRIN